MKVIGVLSGTSADAVDICLVHITSESDVSLLDFDMYPIPSHIQHSIRTAIENKATTREISCLNYILGNLFADNILSFCSKHNIELTEIELIGSHGQTLWHEVNDITGEVDATFQIGEASIIAEKTGVTTISDFRAAHVAAGGQGAPLTAVLDSLVFRPETDNTVRALLNIGGIANVTFVSGSGNVMAFDTGPGNGLIDAAVLLLSNGDQIMDIDGEIARKGIVCDEFVSSILQMNYFKKSPPKTTGKELFSAAMVKQLWKTGSFSKEDFIASLTEVTARSIAEAFAKFGNSPVNEVLVSGGGARNSFLMERLTWWVQKLLGNVVSVKLFEEIFPAFAGDAKEGVLFALLAYLNYKKKEVNVETRSGESHMRILGKVSYGH